MYSAAIQHDSFIFLFSSIKRYHKLVQIISKNKRIKSLKVSRYEEIGYGELLSLFIGLKIFFF